MLLYDASIAGEENIASRRHHLQRIQSLLLVTLCNSATPNANHEALCQP